MRQYVVLLAVCVICLVPGAAVAETTYTAPSFAPDCSVDVTPAIQTWIASVPDNSVLSFASNACYRIEGTIEVTNRNGLVFDGNGSTFKATSTNAPSYRSQWRLTRGSRIVLREMVLRGANPNPGTLNDALQHQHGVDLRGTAGVELDRVQISSTYGDCVYVGQPWSTVDTWSSDVHMHDSSCTGAGRNGVAFTAGRDVLVETSSFERIGLNTFGLEPNGAGFGARNVTIRRNRVGTVAFSVLAALKDSPIENVTFAENTLVGEGMLIAVLPPSGRRYANFSIVGNVSDTGHNAPGSVAMQFVRVDGLTVTGNTVPLSGQNMALASVAESCGVNVSGNSFPGGVAQLRLTPYSSCAPPPVAAPSISSLSPSSGPVGSSVTISGANLSGATAVTLAGRAASFSVLSASQVRATVPSGASSGSFAVTTPGGTATSGSAFTVVTPVAAPSISSLSPSSGPVGSSVTISGANLSGATAVTLAGRAASFSVLSASQVRATVPSGASSGSFAVTTPGGTATSGSAFTVVTPVAAPSISSLSPSSGPVGSSVTISGANLSGATAVTLAGRAASFSVLSASQVRATVPSGASSGSFAVTTPGGTATSGSAFTVVTPVAAPSISSLSPSSGPVGSSVTISGANLSGATAVTLAGRAASFSVLSASQVRATVPSGASSGSFAVTTPGGTTTSGSAFTVVTPVAAPSISSLSPSSGPVGSSVTISGANLSGATTVTLDGRAVPFVVMSASQIVASVPAGASSGSFAVTTPGGSATSKRFRVLSPSRPDKGLLAPEPPEAITLQDG